MLRPHLFIDAPLAGSALALGLVHGLGATLPLALAAGVLHSWGVVSPRSSWYLRVHWRLAPGCRDLALSFDDGPHPETTPRLLDLLAAHGAHATFFCIGRNAAAHPALIRRIVAEGHALGLHSHSHDRRFNCWLPARVGADLAANAAALADASGQAPPELWRPPMGLKNPFVAQACARLGLIAVTWSGRGRDTGGREAAAIAHSLLRAARPRAILLLHDGCEPAHPRDTAPCLTACQQLLPALAGRGLRSGALQRCGRQLALIPQSQVHASHAIAPPDARALQTGPAAADG